MKYLRHIGLVSSLVIGGVLGGLMAPPPSDAGTPTVTLQIDNGTIANIPLSNCTVPSGYTACFALQTGGTFSGTGPAGVTRSFTIKNYLGALPRLLVTDSNGSGLDNLTFTTVEFAPAGTPPVTWGSVAANTGCPTCTPPTYGEVHVLKVVITHKFDRPGGENPRTVGTTGRYQFALRTSGMFKGNLSGASGSLDFVKFEGTGQFGSTSATTPLLNPFPSGAPACNTANSQPSPLDVNYCPLRRTIASTTAPTSSFSTNPALEQVNLTGNPYPSYFCDNGNADSTKACTPTITLKLTATLNGPDSWIFASSSEGSGGSCNLTSPDPGGGPSSNPALPCHSNGKKNLNNLMATYFDNQESADVAAYSGEGAESTQACVGDACGCRDPDVCKGTIVTVARVTPATAAVFPFIATGEGTTNFNITTNTSGQGSFTFSDLLTFAGGPWIIAAGAFPPVGNGVWETDQIACVSQLNTDTNTVTTFTIGSGTNGEKGPVIVNQLGAGDTLTCSWHIHKNSSN